jgi:hypothetical protein
LRGSNCGPPYQVHQQSLLNQLMIGKRNNFNNMIRWKGTAILIVRRYKISQSRP